MNLFVRVTQGGGLGGLTLGWCEKPLWGFPDRAAGTEGEECADLRRRLPSVGAALSERSPYLGPR